MPLADVPSVPLGDVPPYITLAHDVPPLRKTLQVDSSLIKGGNPRCFDELLGIVLIEYGSLRVE